jgi:hypothetical protein
VLIWLLRIDEFETKLYSFGCLIAWSLLTHILIKQGLKEAGLPRI